MQNDSNQAGWEWVDFDDVEYQFSLLSEEEQLAALKALPPVKQESNRMSFDDLIESLKQHTENKGI